ncbi:MAG: helix-turn-helix domain-containing protein [Parcubacteria group bacterium]|nr:helix-turn-helix domain-containing protein [Parcubacteria group bacterium]
MAQKEINKEFGEFLSEEMAVKGFSAEKLAHATNIPERYVNALIKNDFKKLPAGVYARGYIFKIAQALNDDGGELWNLYKNRAGEALRASGKTDKLPANRFAVKKINKKIIVAIAVAALVIAYLLFRADDLIGLPTLKLTANLDDAVVSLSPLTINGEVEPRDLIAVNGENIAVGNDGKFEKEISLQPGVNAIEFKVKRLLGREITEVKRVTYQP